MKKGAPASAESKDTAGNQQALQPGSVFKQPSPRRTPSTATSKTPILHSYTRESNLEEDIPRWAMSSSIITQHQRIRAKLVQYVRFHAYRHEETFEYVSGGELSKMKGLRRILANIDRERGDFIAVASADRLCRFDNQIDRERLFAQRIFIADRDIFYEGQPEIRAQLTELFDAAHAERVRVGERVRAHRQYLRDNNLPVYPPYGFRYNRERTLLFPNPLQHTMLRALMSLLTDDQTTILWRLNVDVWAIAAQVLNDLKYPYKWNRPWSRNIVFKLYQANKAIGETAWLQRYTEYCHRCPAAFDMYRRDQMSRVNVLLCQTCEAALVAEGVDVAHQAQFDVLPTPMTPRPNDPRVVDYKRYVREVLGAVPMPEVIEAQELLARVAPPQPADPVVDQLAQGFEAAAAPIPAPALPPLEDREPHPDADAEDDPDLPPLEDPNEGEADDNNASEPSEGDDNDSEANDDNDSEANDDDIYYEAAVVIDEGAGAMTDAE